jgi:glutathione S-transferase
VHELRLLTIPISHFCEKARWALDRAGLSYREEAHVQGVHRLAARRAGGGTTVPVLVTGDEVIGESREILGWADQRMTPDGQILASEPDVAALCRRFDEVLGPAARRLVYVHMLAQRELVLAYNDQGVPAWEDRLVRHGWGPLTRFIRRALGIVPGIEVQDERIVFAELDHVAGLLADGRPYLCGERFTAADLTFAALSSAVTVPPQYGVRLPQPDVLAPATAELVQRARAHPAGRHAMRLFEHERRVVTAR